MYVKLFSSILDSTIWMEDDHVVRVWLTFLLMCDQEGFVNTPVPAIAQKARVSLDEAIDAIERLESPDRFSRTSQEDGARIVRITEEEALWHIVNYDKYRKIKTEKQRREYHREYMRQYRS